MPQPDLSSASAADSAQAADATRRHLRGSNLLFLGRLIALATNFLVGVLTVRYLSKSDYGAFSYALSIGTTGANAVMLGMPRAISRFAPLYQEEKRYALMYGSLVLSTVLVAVIGLLAVALGVFLREPLLVRFVTDPLSLSLLLILIALAPLGALDSLFQAMLVVFAGPAAIFVRRYVVGPLLRLAAVVLVWILHGNVYAMAWAYLAASLMGVLIYGPMLRRSLERLGILGHFRWSALRWPFREVLGFGLPLVVADVLAANRATIMVVLLGAMGAVSDVADYNAFLKLSGLNTIVLQSMKLLFLPSASRLYARGDHRSIEELYWQTTIWISVITFPVFLPCIAMADSMALVVNGRDYVDASGVLVVLAIGEYFNAALGLNTYTLQVYARVRFLVWTAVAATACGVLAGLYLIPRHGALGAAAATSGTVVLQNLFHHYGLARLTPVRLMRPEFLRVYVSLTVALLLVGLLEYRFRPPLALEIAFVPLVSLVIVRMHRRTMGIASVFPELLKVPLLGRFFSAR